MVGPYAESDESDRCTREHHKRIAEEWLTRERGQDFRDDAEPRQNQHVHLWMTKDPEQVLPEKWVCTLRHIKERGAIRTLEHQQHESHSDYGK